MMWAFRLFLLLGAVFLSTATLQLDAATLHAIIVADTDSNIGAGIDADLFRKELERISSFTGLYVDEVLFSGDHFNSKEVMSYVKALDVDPEDVVLYCHSSHGFRTYGMMCDWPALDFGKQPALDFNDIIEVIKAKPHRLSILLADCCNNYIPEWAEPSFCRQVIPAWVSKQQLKRNYRKLFLDQQGTVIAAACKPGQYAWADLNFGGVFTTLFLAKLRDECEQSKDPSWKSVLEETALTTRELTEDFDVSLQCPIFQINLNSSR